MIHRPRTWLITGATGFLGRAVVRHLQNRPDQQRLILISRKPLQARPNQTPVVADLHQDSTWPAILDQFAPDIVLHLAGRTPPATEAELWAENAEMTFKMRIALENHQKPVRLVHAGSAAELGDVPVINLPVDESYRPDPATPYGKSKWAAATAVLESGGAIEPMVARLFNLIGPGQSANQAFGRYAAQLAGNPFSDQPTEMKAVGLGQRRDFIDVRDAASAIVALADYGHSHEVYHVGTGLSRTVGEGLEILASHFGRSVHWHESPGLIAHGPADSRAEIKRIQSQTGWRPEIRFEQSLADLATEIRSRTSPA